MSSVLITGANRGIGLELVRQFLNHNDPPACIIATCRDTSKSSELIALTKEKKNIHVLNLDTTNFNSFVEFSQKVATIVGDAGLNVLINNAGIHNYQNSIENVTAQDYNNIFNTNLIGPVMLTKTLLPLIKRAAEVNKDKPAGMKRALIVNMSSLLGSVQDNKSGGHYGYRESKVALNSFSTNLCMELKNTGILVNPVHPGWVRTAMGGPNAPVIPEQSANGLVKVIYGLDNSSNGQFFNWDGSILPCWKAKIDSTICKLRFDWLSRSYTVE